MTVSKYMCPVDYTKWSYEDRMTLAATVLDMTVRDLQTALSNFADSYENGPSEGSTGSDEIAR